MFGPVADSGRGSAPLSESGPTIAVPISGRPSDRLGDESARAKDSSLPRGSSFVPRGTEKAPVELPLNPLCWKEGRLLILDQRLLPHQEVWKQATTVEDVADAIRTMQVRGAPAIGIAAAFGMALAVHTVKGTPASEQAARLGRAANTLKSTRPTARNLVWAVEHALGVAAASESEDLYSLLVDTAQDLRRRDLEANLAIGRAGAALLPEEGSVLTHCNTGALATAGWGTALGIIRSAAAQGKRLTVFCTETRPWLQGARLTMWELARIGIRARLMVDSAAGALFAQRSPVAVIVGADRVAANGDVANKIGTYGLAVLAAAHGVPFYVAAPTSSIDLSVADGREIPLEERAPEGVTHLAGQPIAPVGTDAWNPAFDVTPSRYIAAIVTENGLVRPPFTGGLNTTMQMRQWEAVS